MKRVTLLTLPPAKSNQATSRAPAPLQQQWSMQLLQQHKHQLTFEETKGLTTFFRLLHKSAFSDWLNIADITYIELFISSLWAFPLITSWMRSYLMHIISSQFLTMLFELFLGIYRYTNHVLVSSIFHLWVKFIHSALLCI